MLNKILQNTCVRIIISNDNKVINQGSGVIVSLDNIFYVLTAYHCLEGLSEDLSNIVVQKQNEYNSEFKEVNCLSIHHTCENFDWALIKVGPILNQQIDSIKFGKSFLDDEEVIFHGYQSINNKQFRKFKAKILLVSNNLFQININDDTFDQGGEEGQDIAKGLSGSGVYLIKNDTPFLIGIVNSVNSEKAWNDDINCCSISNISIFNKYLKSLSETELLKNWNRRIEQSSLQETSNYKALQNEFYNNLLRKNEVIYGELKTNKISNKNLQKYLSVKENLDDLFDKFPELNIKFQTIVRQFQDTVEFDYSKSVIDENVAKDSKIQLKNKLEEKLKVILPNDLDFDASEFQVIEWLLNCSLDFTKRQ